MVRLILTICLFVIALMGQSQTLTPQKKINAEIHENYRLHHPLKSDNHHKKGKKESEKRDASKKTADERKQEMRDKIQEKRSEIHHSGRP